MEILIKNHTYRIGKETFGNQIVYTLYISPAKAVGSVYFCIRQDGANNYLWLSNISIEPEFQSQGLGQFLFDLMYNDAVLARVWQIEGKYYPSNDKAKPFYDKNNVEIYKDGYETYIYKSVPHDAKPNEYFTQIHQQTEIEEQLKIKREALKPTQIIIGNNSNLEG